MANASEPLQLLRTKLYRPRPTGDLVHRPRVDALLDCGGDRPLTIVCAPAGFGKTTLLSEALEDCTQPGGWVSLDERDNDLAVFLSYLVAAVRTQVPDACANILRLLRAPALPPLHPLVATLSNDLDSLSAEGLVDGRRLVLVLDDYHRITNPDIHALLQALLDYPPPSLHLILSTRQEPPLPLHVLRARGGLVEIGARELSFTPDEASTFMEQALGAPLDPTVLAFVTEQTEGWATGLRFAVLGMSTGLDFTGRAAQLPADDRPALDYLLNEVLNELPISTQDFLLKTSILDQLNGGLCDAVVSPTEAPAGRIYMHGHTYLEWLASQNLFTFALDPQGSWYRYHHLFQRLLRNRLQRQYDPDEIARLHRRASAWLSRHGLIEAAIGHARQAGDEMAAVELVEQNRHAEMNREHWRQLERWLSLLPPPLIDARPELTMLQAWILQKQWRTTDLPAYLQRTEALLEQTALSEADRVRLQSEIDALNSHFYYYQLDGSRTCEAAKRALERAPLECRVRARDRMALLLGRPADDRRRAGKPRRHCRRYEGGAPAGGRGSASPLDQSLHHPVGESGSRGPARDRHPDARARHPARLV